MTDLLTYAPSLSVIEMEALARDLVLYGATDLSGVLESYDLTEESFTELLDTSPVLSNEIRSIRKRVEQDPRAAIRLAAGEVVGQSIPELSAIIQSQFTEAKDRIKAIELASRLADVLPKEAKSAATGVAVQINMGPAVPAGVVAPINPPVSSQ